MATERGSVESHEDAAHRALHHVQQTMERTFVTFLETKAQKDLRSHGPIVLFTHLHEVPEAVGDRQEGLD